MSIIEEAKRKESLVSMELAHQSLKHKEFHVKASKKIKIPAFFSPFPFSVIQKSIQSPKNKIKIHKFLHMN